MSALRRYTFALKTPHGDPKADNPQPFSFGLTIENLTLQSADANWQPSFVSKEEVSRKLVTMSNLAVYHNAREENGQPLVWRDVSELNESMEKLIFESTRKDPGNNDYLLPPITADFKKLLSYRRLLKNQGSQQRALSTQSRSP
eukprot:TRINITY_DN2237_c0_g1_i10.p1 TRINITY_DN2237_c0_g1~~TRINITY_DN2237_c0_g1_i10.p1  ORF type:complete len:144 (+),score=36.50 TRINITY_DN2237_c0_g1_i10:486-917(+)